MTEQHDCDSARELRLLKRVAASGAASADFFRFLLDQVRGTELVVEHESEDPVEELELVVAGTDRCTPELRERYLVTQLARLSCWSYRAKNERHECWSPWSETLRSFVARSQSVEYWVEAVLPATTQQLETWLRAKYHEFY